MPTSRLPDGREVDTASDEWRRHCLARWEAAQPECNRHVANLQRTRGADARREYLATLERADKSMADRVRVEFARWWEAEQKRRAAARSTPTG
jgi:hypothetical protein